MPSSRTYLIAVTAVIALFGCLIAGLVYTVRQIDEGSRIAKRLGEQQWVAEQKQALVAGKISHVHFYSTTDTDVLMVELAGMPEIETLMFELTDLHDRGQGVETIADLPNMTSLVLYGGNPRVGDAGLATISRARSLETLRLVNIDVTDDGLAALRSFPHLEEVTIYQSSGSLSDGAVKQLRTLRDLRRLNISGGWMSDAAFSELKAALPNCSVVKTKHALRRWR